MTPAPETGTTTQTYRLFIKASPEAVWDAITSPEQTERYGYPGHSEYDLRPGGAYRGIPSEDMCEQGAPDVVVDGDVVEAERPRRLVQTWRFLWSPELVAEGFTRVTWDIEQMQPGVTVLTVTHELDGAPRTASQVAGEVPGQGGGWSFILSDLKTLVETGKSLDS
jgi:uncharacterized protein YndB with AHSA1/START domain